MTTDQNPAPAITKRRVVLDLVTAGGHTHRAISALYASPNDDAPGTIGLPMIYLSPEDFLALGEREQITITIEPGNQLTEIDRNAEAEPAQCAEMIALRGAEPVRCERDTDHGGMHWSNAEPTAHAPKKAV